MITYCGSSEFYIVNKQCMYCGKKIPNPPLFNVSSTNLTTIDNKIYLNGYEYFPKQQKWKITPKSIWYYLSNMFW